MKIGLITPTTGTGEGTYAHHIIQGLMRRGQLVQILKNSFLSYRPNVKVVMGRLLLKKLEDEDLKILHNLDNLGPFLFKDRNLNLKRIITIHDIAPVVLPDIHSKIMQVDFNLVLPRLLHNPIS